MSQDVSSYNSIKLLSEIEHVQKNAPMYVGDTEDATHLCQEILDNSSDEVLEGHADKIDITLNGESFCISDNGRGIPIGTDPETGMRYPILAASKLFSGGKFDHENYKVKAGLHGIGITAVNFLSKEFRITSIREGQKFEAEFDNGIIVKQPNGEGFTLSEAPQESRGTTIFAAPSKKVFSTPEVNYDIIHARAKLIATFLDTAITINGEKVEPYSDQELCPGSDTPVLFTSIELGNGEGAIAYLAYDTKGIKTELNQGSVNLLRVDEGAHIRAFENAIMRAWQNTLDEKDKDYLGLRDCLIGAKGFVLFLLKEPRYTGQTKTVLAGKASQYDYVADEISKQLSVKLKERSYASYRNALIAKFKDYRRHVNELNSTTFLNDILRFGEEDDGKINRSLKLDSKLIDASSPRRDETELFICEGDSAGGGLVSQRDSRIHAVLPLRGKSLNVIDRELGKIMQNVEIRSLVNAIGCGVRHKEDSSRIRYGKIILASDADIDGAQIRALLLGALCYLIPQTVASGRIYVAECPLFGQYEGKVWTPVWREMDLIKNKSFKRYKGLGSMEDWQLASVLFDENIRHLQQVTLADAKEVEKLVGYSAYKKELMLKAGVIK